MTTMPKFDWMGNPVVEYVAEGALGSCDDCDSTALVEYHDDTRKCADHVRMD